MITEASFIEKILKFNVIQCVYVYNIHLRFKYYERISVGYSIQEVNKEVHCISKRYAVQDLNQSDNTFSVTKKEYM